MNPIRLLLVLLFSLSFLCSYSELHFQKEILVICPYKLSNSWSEKHLAPISSLEAKDNNHIFAENTVINNTIMESVEDFDRKMDIIFSRYSEVRPDLIVIFGPGNYSLAKDFDKHWKGIPMILCGEFDYMCTKEYVLDSIARPEAIREPLKNLVPELNLTLIHTPIFYEETTQFIHRLIPGLKEITYIGGEDFLSRECHLNMEMAVQKANLKFTPYVSVNHSFDDLLKVVKEADKKRNAIVYKSWHSKGIFLGKKQGYMGSRILLENNAPIFYMHYLEPRGLQGGVGFVGINYDDYNQTMKRCIEDVIENNKQPRDIPFTVIPKDSALANIKGMELHNMDTDLIPAYVKCINGHESLWNTHRELIVFVILGILMLVIIIVFMTILAHRNKNLTLYHKKQLATDHSYRTLVNNIPIHYSRAKLIFNEKGDVENFVFTTGNKNFREAIEKTGCKVGKSTIKEIYPQSAFTFIQRINDAKKYGLKSIKFSIEIQESNLFYNMVVVFNQEDPSIIEIFALDTTELGHTKTQLETLNKQLLQQKEEAEKASNMKTRILQNMSHDIRTPMNAIVGFAQLMTLSQLSEEEKDQYIHYITCNAEIMSMLMDDILNFEQREQGEYNINLAPASCNEIGNSVIMISKFKVQSNVDLQFTSEVDDAYTIHTDFKRVQQILINLLSNACKHTIQGSIHLHCSISENPGRTTFSVTDTGCGIPADKVDKIFQRFEKLSDTEGYGLGLNICTTLADLLHGEVKLDTSYTQGARFILIL